jgi:hypothetical protein
MPYRQPARGQRRSVHHIGDRQTAARPQHTEGLAEHLLLVRNEPLETAALP